MFSFLLLKQPLFYLGTLISCLIGYLIGSIIWAIIIGKIFYNKDVRNYGSKNAGATNANRVFGFKSALLIFFLDAFKAPIVMIFAFLISLINFGKNATFSGISYYLPVLFVAIGHTFPIYFKFKGGKVVSVFIGFSLFINPIYFCILAIVFWSLFFIFKYVSLASIISTIILSIISWIPYISGLNSFINNNATMSNNYFLFMNLLHQFSAKINNTIYYDNWITINVILNLCAILIVLLHHKNIKRLIKKEEPKFVWNSNNKINNK